MKKSGKKGAPEKSALIENLKKGMTEMLVLNALDIRPMYIYELIQEVNAGFLHPVDIAGMMGNTHHVCFIILNRAGESFHRHDPISLKSGAGRRAPMLTRKISFMQYFFRAYCIAECFLIE